MRALVILAAFVLWASPVLADAMIAVPSITIYPGDVISDGQLVERSFSLNSLGKFPVIEQRGQLVGKVARRTLLPGRPIPVNGVKDPNVVSRGGTIIAIYRAGGLTITSIVAPLAAGVAGDVIEARNVDSGRIIHGVIQADGTLRVGAAQ